jgi:hypothetical protein
MSVGNSPVELGTPLLFQSRGRQRMLAGLAHFGPLRVRDATDMAGLYEPTREQLANDAIDMTVRFGDARVQLVALNLGFPAIDELRRLILAVEPEPPGQSRLIVPGDLVVPGREIEPTDPATYSGRGGRPRRSSLSPLEVA